MTITPNPWGFGAMGSANAISIMVMTNDRAAKNVRESPARIYKFNGPYGKFSRPYDIFARADIANVQDMANALSRHECADISTNYQ